MIKISGVLEKISLSLLPMKKLSVVLLVVSEYVLFLLEVKTFELLPCFL